MAYSQNTSVEKMVNRMLKEHLGALAFRRRGFILVSKQTIKNITEQAPDDAMINAAKNAEEQLKEIGMLVGSELTTAAKPTLTDRLNGLRFLTSYNGFATEISSDPSNKKIGIFVKMDMGRKYSLYVGEAIKASLIGYAEADNIEATDSSLYMELTKLQ